MSPALFNIYTELRRLWRKRDIVIGMTRTIKYAVSESEEEMQVVMTNISSNEKEFEMKINTEKTKIIRIGKEESHVCHCSG